MRSSLCLLLKQFNRINSNRTLFESIKKGPRYFSGLNLTRVFYSSEADSHRLNCDIYLLSKDGSLQVHQGPFEREFICEKYGLEPRDLQKIDTDIHINVPIIDVRDNKFICFSFRRLRSLVQADRSILFVPSADRVIAEPYGIKDSVHWERVAQAYHRNVRFIHELYTQRFIDQKLKNVDTIPFEFRITEINLETVAHGLKTKTNELLIEFKNVRERAYTRITVGILRELALLKERIDKYKRNAELAHQAILDVLAHDEDLIAMYLTDNRERDLSDHKQAELLLEACTKQMAEIRRSISDLSDSAHTLESATGFMLDAVRNELLSFEITINIIMMALGMGALVAGIYGMNLSHGFEQSPHAFYIVTGTTFCFISGIIVVGIMRLSRYRKVRLHRSSKTRIF